MKTNWSVGSYNWKLRVKRKLDSEGDSEFGVHTGTSAVHILYDSSDPQDEGLHNDRLLYLSRLAICFYNMREATTFCNVKILKVQVYGCLDDHRYITFQAFSSKTETVPVTFQTKLLDHHRTPLPKFEIIFVRIRPCPLVYKRRRLSDILHDQPPEFYQHDEFDHNYRMAVYQKRLSQVIKTYTIDSQLDSRYGLALYLSQYALFSYCIKLGEPVSKYDIESLKVLNLARPVPKVQTYLITFEAPLLAKTEGKIADTFETEICMPTLFPTTTIELKVKSVKSDSW